MATEPQAHPAKDQLIAFGQGRLPEDESSKVEQHLEICPECCETMLDLKDDTFVGLVKVARLAESDGAPDLNSINSGEITAQDTALNSMPSSHRTGYESEQAATLLGSTEEESVLDELPSELADHPRYRIVGLLGRGGMGNVYRAEHRLMSRPVAIKLINSNLVRNRTAVERFRREVQAAAKLSHPNIVAAYDAEQAGDVHFLVMEFVEGTDLATVVKERGPMSVAEACRCIQQAANGLQHAHEKGMVHRDIKPHNLMLAAGGQVRILDFGLAGFAESTVGASDEQDVATKLESSGSTVSPTQPSAPSTAAHLTTIGSVMGTPDYMAPEQAVDAHSADIRADIYSLGCTLHFLLTGRPPFEREGIAAKLKAHASVSPPSLMEARSDVPIELSDIVARMMAKKPANRFQTPNEVVVAIEQFARKPEKRPRRRLRTWAAGLLVLLAGVIFVQTDKGRVEIQSEVNDAEVVIKQGGNQIDVFDTRTGSQIKWLPSGKYEIQLKGDRNDVDITGNNFKLSRGGNVIVTLKYKTDVKAVAAKPDWKGWAKDTPPPAIAPFNAERAKQHQEAWAKHLGVPVEYTNSVGMIFRLIPPGEFMMGSTSTQIEEAIVLAGTDEYVKEHARSEEPQHRVILTQPFYLGVHEVTQRAYETVTGTNPSYFVASRPGGREAVANLDTSLFPVEKVNWSEAADFCTGLSEKEQLKPFKILEGTQAGNGYRIPTEAQWEFACKAGTTTKYWCGDSEDLLRQAAWIGSTAGGRTHAVGELPANPFGLYDTHGNVWEWVRDGWGREHYAEVAAQPAIDPSYPLTGAFQRVLRGGNWLAAPAMCRSSYRHADAPTIQDWGLGFRVSLPVDAVKIAISQRPIIRAANRFVRDQQAAEWIARIGATQRVNLGGVEKHVAKPAELPDGDWQITEICLYPLRFDTNVKLDKISGLHALRWMRLFGCQITDEALQQMTDLPNLKFLDLDHNETTTDASLAHIATSFPAMEYLSLHSTSISDDGIKHLAALKQLQVLSLLGTKISGAGLKHLADHPSLRELFLGFTTITQEHVQRLSSIPHLETLSVWRATLTDESVAELARLTKLKRLDLRDSTINSANVAQLKAALPNCDIQVFSAEQLQRHFQEQVGNYAWSQLEVTELTATDGPRLKRLVDGSIRAEGANPLRSNYTITAKSSLKQVAALRLDVLLDDTLPSKGPGRSGNGTFVLTGFEVRFTPAPGAPPRLVPLRRAVADYVQQSHDVETIPRGQGSWAIWRNGAPHQNQSLVVELDETLTMREGSLITIMLKHESAWPGHNLGRFRLSATGSQQPSEKPASENLLTDPSFENTPLTQLPNGWRAWLNDGPEFRCEVVAGGHIGQQCLRISGKGTRGVVFANDLKVDRTKRYALKGWVKFEGDKNARAIIKLNYFRGGEFLGVHDLVGASADQPGWHLFEKTDTLDAFPTADHFYAMCHVEGSGIGWFDDLELIAYDRDKLPKDFDTRHGRHNRLHGPNSLHRWIGTWDMECAIREFDKSSTESKLSMIMVSERTLGDYFLLSHAKSLLAEGQEPPGTSKHERLQFLLFDQNLGAFRQWVFNNQGKAFEWRGPWNNDKQTLELRALPDASNLHSAEHFVDEDRIEATLWLQYVMGQRDAGRWTATRKAFDGKVDVPIAKAHATEPAELLQLNKFAGEWTIHAKYKPSVWNPLPREETIRETSEWILGGKFLMTRAFNEKSELTSIWIATYEPKEKSNRFWFFNADGSGGESRLTWDEPSNGFQFRAVDLPDGWSGTGVNRWVDEDSFDNQAVIKDESGRVMLDMTQERRRKK